MYRQLMLALALIAALPMAAWAQSSADLLDAHSRRAPSGSTKPGDMGDWAAYNRAGWRAINKGRYDTAEHEFLSAIKAAKRPGLDDPRLIARSYADYAWALQMQGRNAQAEPLAKWALIAREATLDPNSPPIAQSLNQLATLYLDLGRPSQAEPLLRRALDAHANSTRANTIEHARSQALLGLLLAAQRRYAEAEPPFLQAIKLREKAQGPNHPETGDALSNLAWIYHEQGKDDQARPLFERALKIFERARVETDPSIAHTLSGLGQVLANEGKPAEAEANFVRAIAIFEATPGQELSLLTVLRKYADLLEREGRTAELGKINARIAPLRVKLAKVEVGLGAWYRFPRPTSGSDAPVIRLPG